MTLPRKALSRYCMLLTVCLPSKILLTMLFTHNLSHTNEPNAFGVNYDIFIRLSTTGGSALLSAIMMLISYWKQYNENPISW